MSYDSDHDEIDSNAQLRFRVARELFEAGKVRNALCIVHGGHSKTAAVYLATERCNVAWRVLPAAR